MKKIVIVIGLVSLFPFSFVSADALSGAAAGIAEGVTKAVVGSKDAKVEIKNSTIENQVEQDQSLSMGNQGVSITGKDIEVKDSTITNDVKQTQSANVGNQGIKIGN